MNEVKTAVETAAKKLFNIEIDVELTRPDEQFGDYATNVALQLSKQLTNPPAGGPRAVAEAIAKELSHPSISKTEIAGPGFINISLTDKALWGLTDTEPGKSLKDQVIQRTTMSLQKFADAKSD